MERVDVARSCEAHADLIADRDRRQHTLDIGAMRFRGSDHGRNHSGTGMARGAAMAIVEIEHRSESRVDEGGAWNAEALI